MKASALSGFSFWKSLSFPVTFIGVLDLKMGLFTGESIQSTFQQTFLGQWELPEIVWSHRIRKWNETFEFSVIIDKVCWNSAGVISLPTPFHRGSDFEKKKGSVMKKKGSVMTRKSHNRPLFLFHNRPPVKGGSVLRWHPQIAFQIS